MTYTTPGTYELSHQKQERRVQILQFSIFSPQYTKYSNTRVTTFSKIMLVVPLSPQFILTKTFFFYEYFAWVKGRRWHTVRYYNISDFVTALSSPPQSCGAVVVLGAILLSLFILSPIPEEICQIFLAEMKSSGCNTFLLQHQQSETGNVLWYAKIYWV